MVSNILNSANYPNPIRFSGSKIALSLFALQGIQGTAAWSVTGAVGSALTSTWNGVGYITKTAVEGACEATIDWVIKPIAKATGIDEAIAAVFREMFVKPATLVSAFGLYYFNEKVLAPKCVSASVDYTTACQEGLWKRRDVICFNYAAMMAIACGAHYGAHFIEGEMFFLSMPDPVIKRTIKLAKYAINFLTEHHNLVEGAFLFSFAHFILHPICIEANEDYKAHCSSAFEDLSCTASAAKVGVACGAELAVYIKSGKLFCDDIFPGLCILATYTGK